MKRVEFKNVDLGSVFRLFGGMSFVIGFILALFGGGFGGSAFKQQLQHIPYIGSLTTGFLGAVLIGLFCAVISGLCGAFCAVIYNIFAMIVGGIEVEVSEK